MKKLCLVLALFCTSVFADVLPNPSLTPGATREVSLEELCKKGSSKQARDVSDSVKRQVLHSYGVAANHRGSCYSPDSDEGCEIDHLISLELGGSNEVANLWPQPYFGEWNAHMKDRLENKLHKLVCTGKISLTAAQQLIATDWISGYKTFVNSTPQ